MPENTSTIYRPERLEPSEAEYAFADPKVDLTGINFETGVRVNKTAEAVRDDDSGFFGIAQAETHRLSSAVIHSIQDGLKDRWDPGNALDVMDQVYGRVDTAMDDQGGFDGVFVQMFATDDGHLKAAYIRSGEARIVVQNASGETREIYRRAAGTLNQQYSEKTTDDFYQEAEYDVIDLDPGDRILLATGTSASIKERGIFTQKIKKSSKQRPSVDEAAAQAEKQAGKDSFSAMVIDIPDNAVAEHEERRAGRDAWIPAAASTRLDADGEAVYAETDKEKRRRRISKAALIAGGIALAGALYVAAGGDLDPFNETNNWFNNDKVVRAYWPHKEEGLDLLPAFFDGDGVDIDPTNSWGDWANDEGEYLRSTNDSIWPSQPNAQDMTLPFAAEQLWTAAELYGPGLNAPDCVIGDLLPGENEAAIREEFSCGEVAADNGELPGEDPGSGNLPDVDPDNGNGVVPPSEITPSSEPFTVEYGHGYTHEIRDFLEGYGTPMTQDWLLSMHYDLIENFGTDYLQGIEKYELPPGVIGDYGLAHTGTATWAPGVQEFILESANIG